MATTSDIRKGMCLEHNHDTYIIVEFQHVKPGKGNAFVRTKIKSLTTGKVLDHTFPAGHKVEDVRVERRQYQFLYEAENRLNFMNQETYEQIDIEREMLDGVQFLKEGEVCEVLFHAEKEIPLAVMMPQYVFLQITYVEPGVKGDTATNTLTPAEVETGAEVRVPLFIKNGDLIKINTETGEYMERVKN
ncbi:elongation factor P [Saprospira sp. CCB-QB6]|uniref:elongation factor P n=1 Tax=Saprospira sp. CCB-QB6 TaxID=3023936 RepID=UPI00234A538F|nr:elongation factor P [Saprospira sp. CCB-QB6]WCL80325.1 elongation factor P [Saprospira sp. CCB-QB6]